jgi:hypothetical protein
MDRVFFLVFVRVGVALAACFQRRTKTQIDCHPDPALRTALRDRTAGEPKDPCTSIHYKTA